MDERPRGECAWCGATYRPGPEPAATGCCPPCAATYEAELDELRFALVGERRLTVLERRGRKAQKA